jgi:hypothetical protein
MVTNTETTQTAKNIGIFGSKGAGKTTFLVTLVQQMYNFAISDKWEMNIAGPSHKFFVERLKMLERGQWLESTQQQIPFEFKMTSYSTGESIQLHTADIVGEAFQSTFDPCEENYEEQKMIRLLLDSKGYIFVIDPTKLIDSQSQIEETSIYRALIEFLAGYRNLKPRQKFKEPFAFVLSKGDKFSKIIKSPSRFFYDKMRAVYGKCESMMENYKIFMVSSVGAVEEKEGKEFPKTPIAPQNVFEPFRWVRDIVLRQKE